MNDQENDNQTTAPQNPPGEEHPWSEDVSVNDYQGSDFSSYASFKSHPHESVLDSLFFAAPSNRSTHWSIAWSDLMMTMFVLFMVMFIYKAADKEFLSGQGLGFSQGQPLGLEDQESKTIGSNNYFQYTDKSVSRIYDTSRQLIHQNDLKEFASIDLGPDKTLRIVLTGDLLFDLGEVNLKENARKDLGQIAKIITNTPYMVNVIGHTDDLPVKSATIASNWELSAMRASSVARFLIAKAGLAADHFYVTGYSYHQPIAANDSAANRAKNRRVEIVLTKLLPLEPAPALDNEISKNFPPKASLTQAPAPINVLARGGPNNAI
jgi:chemotaxis protein MotB